MITLKAKPRGLSWGYSLTQPNGLIPDTTHTKIPKSVSSPTLSPVQLPNQTHPPQVNSPWPIHRSV